MNALNDWLHRVWFKPGNSDLAINADGTIKTFGVDWLFMFILWVCIISFVLLMGLMFYLAVVYRRRPGVPPQRVSNHNTPLEAACVGIPLIIVTLIFFWGFWGYMEGQIAKSGAERIDLVAKKWNWTPKYKNGAASALTVYLDEVKRPNGELERRGNVQFPVVVVPAGVPVKFQMISDDVIHSFYIPDMRIKIDVMPNRYTSLTFTPLSADGPHGVNVAAAPPLEDGTTYQYRDHVVFCAEYCGENHSEMAAVLRVVKPDVYDKIIRQWGDRASTMAPLDLGKALIAERGCVQCHSVDGKDGTGPSFKGYYGKPVPFSSEGGLKLDLSKETDWDTYIRESILEPKAKIHKGFEAGNMPSFQGQLSEAEINAIAAYIRFLNDKARPTDSKVPEKKKPGEAAPAGAAPADAGKQMGAITPTR